MLFRSQSILRCRRECCQCLGSHRLHCRDAVRRRDVLQQLPRPPRTRSRFAGQKRIGYRCRRFTPPPFPRHSPQTPHKLRSPRARQRRAREMRTVSHVRGQAPVPSSLHGSSPTVFWLPRRKVSSPFTRALPPTSACIIHYLMQCVYSTICVTCQVVSYSLYYIPHNRIPGVSQTHGSCSPVVAWFHDRATLPTAGLLFLSPCIRSRPCSPKFSGRRPTLIDTAGFGI